MIKAILAIVALTSLAQVLPSCGDSGSTEVIGWVEAKGVSRMSDGYYVTINGSDYAVPAYFWAQVKVGDLVKWDGTTWTIVKKAAGLAPFRFSRNS